MELGTRSSGSESNRLHAHAAADAMPVWSALHQHFSREFSARRARNESGLASAAGSFDASVARVLSALDNPLSAVNRTALADGKSTVVKDASVTSNIASGDRG